MNECRTRFPHAELPHRAAQVDHQEFEGLEDPGRSAFDADYQPALVVDREAGGRVDAERRVEFVVKSSPFVLTGGFRPFLRRIIDDGFGSCDDHRTGRFFAQDLSYFRNDRSLRQIALVVGVGPDRFGQYDEVGACGSLFDHREQQSFLHLLRSRSEFVVTVDVGLHYGYRDRAFIGCFVTPENAQRNENRKEYDRSGPGPGFCVAPTAPGLVKQDIREKHPERTAEDACVFVPLHGPHFVRESVAQQQPGPGEVAGRVPVLRGDPA